MIILKACHYLLAHNIKYVEAFGISTVFISSAEILQRQLNTVIDVFYPEIKLPYVYKTKGSTIAESCSLMAESSLAARNVLPASCVELEFR